MHLLYGRRQSQHWLYCTNIYSLERKQTRFSFHRCCHTAHKKIPGEARGISAAGSLLLLTGLKNQIHLPTCKRVAIVVLKLTVLVAAMIRNERFKMWRSSLLLAYSMNLFGVRFIGDEKRSRRRQNNNDCNERKILYGEIEGRQKMFGRGCCVV